MNHFPTNQGHRTFVTTEQLYRSRDRVKLICGFYGPTHPKCKQVVDEDTSLYMDFLKQFKIDDSDDDTEN